MHPVLIFRHFECEGPGYFTTVLERHDIPYRLIAVDQGEAVPAHIKGASALVFMGGPMSVNDPLPWITDELDVIRAAYDARLPVLGHCLGAQLMAKALGGEVRANPTKEIGWHDVTATAASPWLQGLSSPFKVFHWHGETYTLPEGATRLLHSRWCAQQAFVMDNMLGLQCHVEMTAEMVREWSEVHAAELATPSASVQSAAEMTRDLETRVVRLQQVADVLYGQWLEPLLRSGR